MPVEAGLEEGRARLVLNDPPRNLLGPATLEGMLRALARFRDAGAPPLLLASRGKHFSTG